MYVVKESGLEFQQNHQSDESPVSSDAYLKQFRCVVAWNNCKKCRSFYVRYTHITHRDGFEMRILEQNSPNELVLELLHVDTSFVNALRRILLAEVPTVALENIFMWNNTSIIHDEVLAHRLGLIPLNIDARLLEAPDEEDDSPTDRNTVVFRMMVKCTKPPKEEDAFMNDNDEETPVASRDTTLSPPAAAAASRPPILSQDRPYTKHVYSRDLEWVPQGDQATRFPQGLRPMHDDILIAKLRPGQAIELEAHGRVGIGKDHAKYSPVATASYRLMPRIELLEDIYDELAEELVHVYEPGVFDLVPVTDVPGRRCKAVLVNPYACTMSRNYMRNPALKKAIAMSRISDHFIFSIESIGMYNPAVLVAEALRILQRKCTRLMDLIDESQDQPVA